MKKGRITQIEQTRRLKLLFEFIFIFRYASREQLLNFTQNVIKLSYPRWLIEYSLKQGYLKTYYIQSFRTKIYYLTEKAKALIYEQEALIKHYRFDTRYTGSNTLLNHNIQVETYFLLNKYLGISTQHFLCGWLLKASSKKYERQPDALATLSSGLQLAIEVEVSLSKLAYYKKLISLYQYDIEKVHKYHAVLFITPDKYRCECIKNKLFYLNPELCKKAVIFSDLDTLKLGGCFYQEAAKDIKEALSLFKPGNNIDTSQE